MILGIDLGTTNSAAAIWRDGAAVLVPNSLGDYLTPSAVSVGDDGAILVGLPARERQASHPDRTATAFKRMIGTKQVATLGKHRFSPEDLSALVLRALKADAEAMLGAPVTAAVITVPAYFNNRQRKATRRAGELAGLKVERLINEPTAAALAYGIHEREDREPFLVFDLGGGTFDVSVVEIYDGIIEVRASAGDNRLGGEDFNDAMVDFVKTKLDPAVAATLVRFPAAVQAIRVAVERARRVLSDAEETVISFRLDETQHDIPITTAEFEAAAAKLVDRLREPVVRALRDGNIPSERLSDIVMVGGATRMPLIRRTVTRMFGRFPNSNIHPDHAVALGAAVQAGLKSRDSALEEVRLVDVCPFTLGVDTAERDRTGQFRTGLFSPIIERNTVVPVSRVETYSTLQDNQTVIEFGIFQGESHYVSENVRLGSLRAPVPARPAGAVQVNCRFSYDASGLLEVDITVPETGLTRSLVIVDQEDAPSEADLDKRRRTLAALKIHPRDDAENAAALARAGKCYEGFLAERRVYVGQLITQFETALDKQDPRQIEGARKTLHDELDALEGERFL